MVRSLVTYIMLWIRRRPALFVFVLNVVHLFPPLERWLLASAHSRGLGLSYQAANRAGHFEWQLDVEPASYDKWAKLLR